jgi:hypothetical protein
MRRLRPTLAIMLRWPRTGSACRPATHCRNAGSPRCSDAHPAAGREPESPRHGKHRRPQTRRVPRPRLTRKQRPPAVSPERDCDRAGKIGNPGPGGQPEARFCVNLDAMRVKGLAWLGITAGDYAVGPVLRRDPGPGSCLRCGNTVELTAGNGEKIQLFGPGHRNFEFYRSHGDSTVPLLEVDDLDHARPSWPAAAPGYSASRSKTAPGPGSPSGHIARIEQMRPVQLGQHGGPALTTPSGMPNVHLPSASSATVRTSVWPSANVSVVTPTVSDQACAQPGACGERVPSVSASTLRAAAPWLPSAPRRGPP